MKGLIATSAVCLILLAWCNIAQAGDFTVTYAIQVGDSIESGVLEACQSNRPCEIKSSRLGLSITVYNQPYLSIYLDGNGRSECCYFANAESSMSFKERTPPRNFPIFEGRKRHGLEVIYNHQIGTLSLIVSSGR